MNIDPILMCAKCNRPTLHLFVERRLQHPGPGEAAFDSLVYACDRCGAPRTWGNVQRESSPYTRGLAETAFAHAVDVHGMHRGNCSACHGIGLDCSECDDQGEVWLFESPEPCGPGCPLATRIEGAC
jgi:hypothetical protein